ncbi:MAG: haloalkane dehalogenase [Myxococcota bacterium]|jgi:haloalkane dehalogenase
MSTSTTHLSPVNTTVTALAAHVPAEFPFESRYIEVLGSKMHYVEEGEGEPILFIHGNPASSYLWRNILPHLQSQGRCIALDLIGMGRSDHPDIDYTYDDQSRYLAAFIDALGIGSNLTLVIHDWGSMLGFRWACEHPEQVRAVAFMEAMVRPLSFSDLPGSLKIGMRVMRNPFFNWLMVGVGNVFLKQVLPDLTYRKMSPEVLAQYRAPFPTVESRRAVRRFPIEVPFDGNPSNNYETVTKYIDWIARTDVPLLLLHGDDGVAIKAAEIAWLREHATDLTVVDLGAGKHFLQETHPVRIGTELSRWYARI